MTFPRKDNLYLWVTENEQKRGSSKLYKHSLSAIILIFYILYTIVFCIYIVHGPYYVTTVIKYLSIFQPYHFA